MEGASQCSIGGLLMLDDLDSRQQLLLLAIGLGLVGTLLVRNGSKVLNDPSFDPPLISGTARAFLGATLLFIFFAMMLTWIKTYQP
jgi:hypothetical protein